MNDHQHKRQRRLLRLHRPPAHALSDQTLLRRVARGDADAFAQLYERYQQPLYRYCRSLVGEHDAADALQSAMTSAWSSLQGETRTIELKPWLYRVAHNESISILRRRRDSGELDEQQACSADVAGTVIAHQELTQLVADLRSLPERQRGALVMRELSGLEYDEIAAALEVTGGAARQTVYEARLALHELREGRRMRCDEVQRTLSDRDGRTLRSRRMRAHLDSCADCAGFRQSTRARKAAMALMIPPMSPQDAAAAAARTLGELGHTAGQAAGAAVSSSTAAGATAGAANAGAVKVVAGKLVAAKVAAALAVTGGAGATAATVHERAQAEQARSSSPAVEVDEQEGALVGSVDDANDAAVARAQELRAVAAERERALREAADARRTKAAAARERAAAARQQEVSSGSAAAAAATNSTPAAVAPAAPAPPPATQPAAAAPPPAAPQPAAPQPVAPPAAAPAAGSPR